MSIGTKCLSESLFGGVDNMSEGGSATPMVTKRDAVQIVIPRQFLPSLTPARTARLKKDSHCSKFPKEHVQLFIRRVASNVRNEDRAVVRWRDDGGRENRARKRNSRVRRASYSVRGQIGSLSFSPHALAPRVRLPSSNFADQGAPRPGRPSLLWSNWGQLGNSSNDRRGYWLCPQFSPRRDFGVGKVILSSFCWSRRSERRGVGTGNSAPEGLRLAAWTWLGVGMEMSRIGRERAGMLVGLGGPSCGWSRARTFPGPCRWWLSRHSKRGLLGVIRLRSVPR